MTYFSSNDSISRIKSITLVYARDLANCAAWKVSCSFENKDTTLQMEVVSNMAY